MDRFNVDKPAIPLSARILTCREAEEGAGSDAASEARAAATVQEMAWAQARELAYRHQSSRTRSSQRRERQRR